MASSSKPTAVHFALVFFVMTTLILALVTYLTGKEYSAAAANARAEADKASNATTALNNALSDIDALKELLGYQFEQVGAGGNAPRDSIVGAAREDLKNHGREQQQPSSQNPTIAATLQSLRSALDSAQTQVQTQQVGLQETEARMTQEITTFGNNREQIANSQQESEAQLQRLVTERDEIISEKDREIAKWRQEYQQELVNKEAVRDELDNVRKEKNEIITDLELVVDNMRDRLNDLENLSFDIPDARIVRVDNTVRTVWIDVGSADQLRKQVSFSVYTKNHQGVGRDRKDIKAKIEVIAMRGPHLAEARILEDDIRRPIQEGDPIWSPLWSKGLKEYFSFIGVLDMDGDGESDRELLRDIIRNAGAGIEVEIDDKGRRIPEESQLSVKTKFLVVGDIEDPTQFPGFADKQQDIQKVMEEHEALLREARRQGIRVITFRDFLNYIGFKPQQRLYVAGDKQMNLKHGKRSAVTDEVFGASRLSTGQTSEIFKRGSERKNGGSPSGMYRN